MLFCPLYNSIFAQADTPTDNLEEIDITCQVIKEHKPNEGIHRMPIRMPSVYLDKANHSILFETPCYSTLIEIVIPNSDINVYTSTIPDGDNIVSIPEWLEGIYELHIHKGNYCFWGIIEL